MFNNKDGQERQRPFSHLAREASSSESTVCLVSANDEHYLSSVRKRRAPSVWCPQTTSTICSMSADGEHRLSGVRRRRALSVQCPQTESTVCLVSADGEGRLSGVRRRRDGVRRRGDGVRNSATPGSGRLGPGMLPRRCSCSAWRSSQQLALDERMNPNRETVSTQDSFRLGKATSNVTNCCFKIKSRALFQY